MQEQISWVAFAAWVVAMAGWLATHLLSVRRETRKLRAEQIKSVIELVDELVEEAVAYWTGSPSDPKVEASGHKASYILRKIGGKCDRLELTHHAFELQEALGSLFDAATGGDFQSKTRSQLAVDDARLNDCRAEALRLIDAIEMAYYHAYEAPLLQRVHTRCSRAVSRLTGRSAEKWGDYRTGLATFTRRRS